MGHWARRDWKGLFLDFVACSSLAEGDVSGNEAINFQGYIFFLIEPKMKNSLQKPKVFQYIKHCIFCFSGILCDIIRLKLLKKA